MSVATVPQRLEEYRRKRRGEGPITADQRYWNRIAAGLMGRAEPEAHTKRFVGGPEPFIENVLDFHMWEMQREIVRSVMKYPATAVRSCHAAGKSSLSARTVLAYLHEYAQSIAVTTAPTNRQVENVLWRNINAAAARATEPLLGRALKTRYEIAPDWYGLGFTGNKDNTDAMHGFHAENILVVVDEAAGVHEGVLQNLESILTGTGARLLLIGNPTSVSGTFRNAFHQAADAYNLITITAYDTPNFTYFGITREDMLSGAWEEKVGDSRMPFPALIDPRWVARQFVVHGPESAYVRSRVDAEFPSDDGTTLISLAVLDVLDQMVGEYDEVDQYEPWFMGMDCARFGDDENSCALVRGRALGPQIAWKGLDTMASAGKVQDFLGEAGMTRETVELNIDVGGQGAGIADRLRELGWNVNDINFGGKSSDPEKWPILRHEMWWQLRERIREGALAPMAAGTYVGEIRNTGQMDELAKGQLSDVKYTYDSRGRVIIEPKAEAKRRGVRSPDRGEAVMLACYRPPEALGAGVGSSVARASRTARPGSRRRKR